MSSVLLEEEARPLGGGLGYGRAYLCAAAGTRRGDVSPPLGGDTTPVGALAGPQGGASVWV